VSTLAAEVRAAGMRAAMEKIEAEEPEQAPGWLMDNLAETQPEMFALVLEAWATGPAVWADFPHVQAPSLVICGEHEEPSATQNAQLAAAALPQGASVVLPGLWHLQAFWRTDQTLPPLTRFLRQHLGSS
jgi:pimeloyl-ACP methyl ester carboxylesterase